MLGADVTLVAPATLLPPVPPAPATDDLDSVIEKIDVLYLLRMQRERMTEALVPSLREYSARFGLTPQRASRLPEHALVMHPGPMNRGVEILVDPAELPGAVITQQVANGVAVRMAVLFELLGCGRIAVTRARSAAAASSTRRGSGAADVLIDGDRIAAGRRRARTATRRSTPPAASSPRVRRPPRPPPRAGPGGGRDDRDRQPGRRARRLHRRRGDAEHRPGAGLPRRRRVRARPRRGGRAVRGAAGRLHHDRPGGGGAGAVRRARRRRRAPVHRRRQRRAGPAADAPGDGVLARPRHRARPALRGRPAHRRRGDARGALLQRARPARLAGARRGADGPPRHRAVPAHRRADPPAAPVDGAQRRARPAAKADGLAVTAEVTPHHLALTDEALRGYDPVFKVNPPLRTADDVAALKAGLADGTIDAIATDHAPHPVEDKERPLDDAPPGMLGLETALGVALAVLDMPLADVVAALSWKPAAIAGVADRHGVADRGGQPGQPRRVRPRRRVAGAPGRAGQPQPQHAVRRHGPARQGPPHRVPRSTRSCATGWQQR